MIVPTAFSILLLRYVRPIWRSIKALFSSCFNVCVMMMVPERAVIRPLQSEGEVFTILSSFLPEEE